jgi:hypothetical protein
MYGGPTGKLIDITRNLPLLSRIGTRATGGGAIGAGTAAAIEEAPTMEQIPERKAEAAKYGAGVGALLTPTIPGIGELLLKELWVVQHKLQKRLLEVRLKKLELLPEKLLQKPSKKVSSSFTHRHNVERLI